ncbi:MAG: DEAD/DEAH box helicase, partial [Phycisphaeraceae bacterium]|nr:DEAD/DEAH box helicase [Phycisphaeraceae bacterium]
RMGGTGFTMTLPQIWSGYFLGDVRMRGRAFFLDGRVEQVPPQDGEYVRAEVRDGDGVCVVLVRLDQGPSRVQCSCHRGEGDAYCEHAWATLLDVQENGPLEAPDEEAPAAVNGLVADAAGRPRWPKARKREGNGEPLGLPVRRQPGWLDQLNLLRPTMASLAEPRPILPRHRVVHYVVSPDLCREHGGLVVDLRQDDPSLHGGRRTRSLRLAVDRVADLAQEIDRELCGMLLGAQRVGMSEYERPMARERGPSAYKLPAGAQRQILRRMIETGRCWLEHGLDAWPIHWEGDEPWSLWLRGRVEGGNLVLTLQLRRASRVIGVHEPAVLLGGVDGVVICRASSGRGAGPVAEAGPVDDGGALRWANQFRDDHAMGGDKLMVPRAEIAKFLEHLYLLPNLPELDLPAELAPEPVSVQPEAHLELVGMGAAGPTGSGEAGRKPVGARVWFAYGSQRVKPGTAGRYLTAELPSEPAGDGASQMARAVEPSDARRPVRRDTAFEHKALTELLDLGFAAGDASPEMLTLASGAVADAVETLLARGWTVMAEQRVIRRASAPRFTITSGIDWFELRGELSYATGDGQETVSLPAILAAAGSGRQFITLSDGTLGALPQEWLSGHELLTSLGKLAGDHLRFKSSQAALLDALLASQPAVDVDGRFSEIRRELGQFDRIEPLPPAGTFEGELRTYQKEGLGWLAFLRRFGLGGILADDMGLGKTVQVLAMLDAWYGKLRDGGDLSSGGDHRPTLVVAPRSVVFNWVDEAKRFTPNLRVQAYAGTDRHSLREAFDRHDVIVTSYGLLRRDAAELRGTGFEYVVLDEAQAIKNPHSQGAKAARVIQSGHRLALTGTPVENHLGDLWSIFEFLNPGILGSSTRFAELMRGGASPPEAPPPEEPRHAAGESEASEAAEADEQERGRLKNQQVRIAWQAGRALRPFILRRTKKQVLSELPEKTEQTIVCEMDPAQRQIYDQLRDHYRHVLLRGGNGKGPVAGDLSVPGGHGLSEGDDATHVGQPGSTSGGGGGGGAMLVLEALLRLRQAACHPALIDPTRTDVPSAKLDVLLEQVEELVEEGHKALVFSQFTSLLALVRPKLEERGLVYEYLDGKTRDREERVRRFQNDPHCPLFLVSLKAGGLGLNLTAADYVFLLDPWWNPAVEQQAIDRAHRIGQTRPVFAYRLVCQDTVEQRIQELQARKKEIAAAIVSSPENILRHLSREDLERLLS